MQQIYRKSKGKTYLVNVATSDDGIGAGFAMGQLVMKSVTDNYWYVTTASGSAPSPTIYVSESKLTYFSASFTSSTYPYSPNSFFDQNYPYQLVQANNGLNYAIYLSGSAPSASVVVSQSAWTGSSQGKPYLILQSISDSNYYIFGLSASLSASVPVITLVPQPQMVSQSWVHPIY
jgi:hypothetical protein